MDDKDIQKLKNKVEKIEDEIKVVKKVESYFEFVKTFRAKIDWQWYIYDQYYRGNHYVQWNKFTKSIETPPRNNARDVRVTVNLVYTVVRAVKNFITRGRPLFEAMPIKDTDESMASARTATKLLHSWWRNLRLLKVFKGAAKYGLKYGLAVIETGWDETLKKGKGDVFVTVNDPFDIYIDPQATCIEDARFIIKTIKKSIASIKENPNYGDNKGKIVGEEKQAASSYKEMSLENMFQTPGEASGSDDDLSSSILYECWLKSSENGKTKIRVITICEHQLLRDDESDLDEYPFDLYQVEDNPNEIYPEGWIKNIFPLNKIIDRLESQVVRYNNTMLKGKYIVDKNAGITNISTDEGEIIEKAPGTEVSHLSLKPLPNSINIQISNFYKYIELIGGSPEALQGNVPTGVRSGRGIEALQAGAANTLQDARENMEDTIANVGRKLIKIASAKYTKARVIKLTGLRGAEFFKVIGDVDNAPEGVEKLEPLEEIYVTLSSELAYTKDVQTERLIQLKQLGIIDDRTMLEKLPVGDVETVLDRLMEEKQQRAEMEDQFAGGTGKGAGMGIKKDKPNELMGQPQVGNAMPNIPKP